MHTGATFSLVHVFLALAIAAGASALFLTLSVFDNKYAAPGSQAINGLLYVDEASLESTPVRYLCDGWALYPDELLTPATLPNANADALRYVSLGQFGNFSLGDERRSPHGCGTYVMTMNLPAEEHQYALEIPEVYSAYRLYVDDQLVSTRGNPDAEEYQDAVSSNLVVFSGKGTITLMFAVSDYAYFYSGMTHPPAFGEPSAVDDVRITRIAIAAATVGVSLLLSLLALILAFAVREKRYLTILFALLCFCTALFVAYPLVRGLITLPVQPWYTLELVSGYAIMLLCIAICNDICQVDKLAARVSSIVAGAFCLLVTAYGLGAANLDVYLIAAFSNATFVFKLAAAVYVLAAAARRVGARDFIEPMLYAAIFYAVSILWDCLIPAYEPILGGWFMEWGSLALMLAVGVSLTHTIASGYRRSLSLSEQRRHMEQQMAAQSEHLKQAAAWEEADRRVRHDFRQHLNLMVTLIHEGQIDELASYVETVADDVQGVSRTYAHLADHVEINALLNHYHSLARTQDVTFTSRVILPQNVSIRPVDLCIIVGNLLENAFEACARHRTRQALAEAKGAPTSEASPYAVFVGSEIAGSFLTIVVDNSPAIKPRMHNGRFFSSKRDGWGIGLASVRDTVKALGGTLSVDYQNQQFSVTLHIPVEDE